jgi:hypothetical protein
MIVSGLSATRQGGARILGISSKPAARVKANLFWPCRVGHFLQVPCRPFKIDHRTAVWRLDAV